MEDNFEQTKAQGIQRHIAELTQEYQAVSDQISLTLNAAQRVILERQLEQLEKQINQKNEELVRLNAQSGSLAAGSGMETVIDTDTVDTVGWPQLQYRPELLIGQSVGSYLLNTFLGAGGSGMVYHASHRMMTRNAAIKLIYPLDPSYTEFYTLFERGFRALGTLNHTNIVQIHDCGTVWIAQRELFFVGMEYVDGVTLDVWSRSLSGAPHAFAARLEAAIALTDALVLAHSTSFLDRNGMQIRGALHGDVKPANILMSRTGVLKLTDFLLVDIQRLLHPDKSMPTQTKRHKTEMLGTPGFMAPEQSQMGMLTSASDIYSLGITFMHLFYPDSGNPLINMLTGTEPSIPKDLVVLILQMTKESPDARPSSASEVVRQLRTFRPIQSHVKPTEFEEPANISWSKRLANMLKKSS
jgi:serine/threonine protein kinase